MKKKIFLLIISVGIILLSHNLSYADTVSIMGSLDSPADNQVFSVHEKIIIAGWVAPSNLVEKIEISINGQMLGVANYGLVRNDVVNAFKDMPNSKNCGFEYHVKSEEISLGENVISIVVKQKAEEKLTLPKRIITVKNQKETIGVIDSPKKDETVSPIFNKYLQIGGWVIDNEGIEKVEVYLDGELIGQATYGIKREDVRSAYPSYSDSLNSGYNFKYELSKIDHGYHNLRIKAISKNGTFTEIESSVVKKDASELLFPYFSVLFLLLVLLFIILFFRNPLRKHIITVYSNLYSRITLLNKDKAFITLLLTFSIILFTSWALVVPFNAAPDELQRFDIADFIYKYKELPTAFDSSLIRSVYGTTYAHLPNLGYLIGGFLMTVFSTIIPEAKLYIIARLVSVIFGVLSVFYAFKICNKLFKNSFLKYLIPSLFALIPQFAFISGYVNLESITVFAVIYIIYVWMLGIESKWSVSTILKLGVGISICLLSYYNGYVIIPLTGILFLATIKDIPSVFIKKVLLLSIVVSLLSGWWFVRNYMIYDGDILGIKTNAILSEKYAIDQLKPSNLQSMYRQGYTYLGMLFKTIWVNVSYKSFWAAFGYMNLWLEEKHYDCLKLLHLISTFGLLMIIYDKIKLIVNRNVKILKVLVSEKVYILLFISIFMTVFLSFYTSYYNDFQPQGRYLFPAIFQIVLLLGIGLDRILPVLIKKYTYILIILFMIWLNLKSLCLVFKTYY